MKKLTIITLTLVMALMGACKTEKTDKAPTPAINVSLTDTEKAGGVLTPEIMWKYGRIGTVALSPDGSTVLWQVTNYDLPTEARATNIWSVTSSGGDPVQLTTEGGAGPQWIDNGAKIAFLAGRSIISWGE